MTATTEIPAEELARERLNRYMQDLADQAPKSLAAHAMLLHKTDIGRQIIPARHHLEWVRFLEDFETHRWIVLVAPPGYAKSTWCSVVYPAWRIGATKGKVRIGLVSNTASLTHGLARSIMRTVQDPMFHKVYGIGPDTSKGWSQSKFWVDGSIDAKNPTVMATGIGGPIQGMRYDEIVLDDPTTWEDARSDVTMEAQRHFLRALLLQRFPPGMGPPDGDGRMVVVLTRWGEADLVPTLQDVGFKVITMPALGYWDRNEVAPGEWEWGHEPLWPEKESRAMLEKHREENELTFELVMQGNPRVLGGDVFNPNDFQQARMPDRQQFRQVVQFVDTASGKDRKRGDYFVCATVGVEVEGKVWIMDIERGYFPAPDQEKAVMREYAEWNPEIVYIEDVNEGTALYQRMVVDTRLPLKAIRPVKDKEFRAIPLANAYKARLIWHPDGARWVRPYEMELAGFPRGRHDDQVDAAAGAFAQTAGRGPQVRVLARSAPSRRFT